MTKLTPEEQVRLLRTTPHPNKPGATDVRAMDNRALVMDALYTLAGRDNPNSTMHGLYTGLWAQAPDTLP
jgi:hypothetical protein